MVKKKFNTSKKFHRLLRIDLHATSQRSGCKTAKIVSLEMSLPRNTSMQLTESLKGKFKIFLRARIGLFNPWGTAVQI